MNGEPTDLPDEGENNAERETRLDAMDRANRQNSILHEARMLPQSELLPEHENAIRERFGDYIKEHGISLTQAAREIKYSLPTISAWQSAKYHGDSASVSRAVG